MLMLGFITDMFAQLIEEVHVEDVLWLWTRSSSALSLKSSHVQELLEGPEGTFLRFPPGDVHTEDTVILSGSWNLLVFLLQCSVCDISDVASTHRAGLRFLQRNSS